MQQNEYVFSSFYLVRLFISDRLHSKILFIFFWIFKSYKYQGCNLQGPDMIGFLECLKSNSVFKQYWVKHQQILKQYRDSCQLIPDPHYMNMLNALINNAGPDPDHLLQPGAAHGGQGRNHHSPARAPLEPSGGQQWNYTSQKDHRRHLL